MSPLFREIKKLFPEDEIDFLTSTSFAEVLANNPHISQIIPLDRKSGSDGFNEIINHCEKKDYGLVFDAHNSLRSRLLLFKTYGAFYGKKKNITSINKRSLKRNLLLTFRLNLFKKIVSQREAYLGLLENFARPCDLDDSTELFPSAKDKDCVRRLLEELNPVKKKMVALGPGASFEGKCWPKEKFLEIAGQLQEEGYLPVLIGGPDDKEPGWIFEHLVHKPPNLSGRLSFLEVAELLSHCELTISNDTALVHFSEAMKTPAVSIFGPTAAEFGYGPFLKQSRLVARELKCRPCSRNGKGGCLTRSNRECLGGLMVKTVWDEAMEALGRNG